MAAHCSCDCNFVCYRKQLVFGNRVAYYSAGDSELVKKDDLHHSESTRHNKTARRNLEIRYTGRCTTQVVYALKVENGATADSYYKKAQANNLTHSITTAGSKECRL